MTKECKHSRKKYCKQDIPARRYEICYDCNKLITIITPHQHIWTKIQIHKNRTSPLLWTCRECFSFKSSECG